MTARRSSADSDSARSRRPHPTFGRRRMRSGALAVFGQDNRPKLSSGLRNLNPAPMAVARDLDGAERLEGGLTNAVVILTDDRLVDVPGDNQGQRIDCDAERLLDAGI